VLGNGSGAYTLEAMDLDSFTPRGQVVTGETSPGAFDPFAIIGGTEKIITTPNVAPIASAGLDKTVINGAPVTLDGSGSSDPDHGPAPLTYAWSQISGPAVTLTGATTANPTFTPTQTGDYAFSLVVFDGQASSPPDAVTVKVADVPIHVLLPNGGETWKVGIAQTIKWYRSSTLVYRKIPATILLSKDGGKIWLPIGIDLRNTGSYSWKPSRLFTTKQALVQVCSLSNQKIPKPVCDTSDATFTIAE